MKSMDFDENVIPYSWVNLMHEKWSGPFHPPSAPLPGWLARLARGHRGGQPARRPARREARAERHRPARGASLREPARLPRRRPRSPPDILRVQFRFGAQWPLWRAMARCGTHGKYYGQD